MRVMANHSGMVSQLTIHDPPDTRRWKQRWFNAGPLSTTPNQRQSDSTPCACRGKKIFLLLLLVDNRRRWTNAKVTPIQHPAPAVGIMSGHCRKDVQPPNQDMVNRRAFCPAYTTRQKRRRGQCWASVCSAGQTPTQQMARVLCMPCHQYIIYYCNAEYYACKILLLHNSNIIGFSCVCLWAGALG